MSKLGKVFEDKKALIAFVTGGDPDIETTEKLIPQMVQAGVDIIEIGIPFSDPIAEGIDIQEADERALAAGATTDKLFDMVKRVNAQVKVPMVFMTYMNPVYTYGIENFMKKCAECGVAGVIIPDVPFEEREEVSKVSMKYGVEYISMVAPASKERIRMVSNDVEGFVYCASTEKDEKNKVSYAKDMLKQIRKVSDVPCAVVYDTVDESKANEFVPYADGIIIANAIVKLIGKYGTECVNAVCEYISQLKEILLEADSAA